MFNLFEMVMVTCFDLMKLHVEDSHIHKPKICIQQTLKMDIENLIV